MLLLSPAAMPPKYELPPANPLKRAILGLLLMVLLAYAGVGENAGAEVVAELLE